MKHIVTVTSDLYGSEDFEYDTEREALAGLRRLKEWAAKLQDNIERTYTLSTRKLDE